MAIRRTNRGAQIDMDALIASSEKTPAVGNMKVNAKGDVLGANGEIVKKNEQRVREYYRNNPRSSTANASLKGKDISTLQPDTDSAAVTSSAKKPTKSRTKKSVAPAVDEFDSATPEPLGMKEVQLPNGDIQMVPYYREEDQ